jgi:hypothetical protein
MPPLTIFANPPRSYRANGRTRRVPYALVWDRVLTMDAAGRWAPILWTTQAWPTTAKYGGGKPTDANLARYVLGQERATEPGGVNAHIGVSQVIAAHIVRQSDGATMATYQKPLFQVNPPDVPLEHFRDLAAAMHGGEPQDWEWVGPHMSQRMFGISQRRAEEYAARHGGTARQMPATNPPAVRFKDLPAGAVFEFDHTGLPSSSGIARGPWVKTGARKYDSVDGHLRGVRIGSINAKVVLVTAIKAYHENPPRSGVAVSDRVYEIRYKHAADGKNYRHPFQAGVCAEWLPDGSVRLYHKNGKPLMREFPATRKRRR